MTRHTAIICGNQIIGVFKDGHSILEAFDEAQMDQSKRKFWRSKGHPSIYSSPTEKRLYEEWRKLVEGKRHSPLILRRGPTIEIKDDPSTGKPVGFFPRRVALSGNSEPSH